MGKYFDQIREGSPSEVAGGECIAGRMCSLSRCSVVKDLQTRSYSAIPLSAAASRLANPFSWRSWQLNGYLPMVGIALCGAHWSNLERKGCVYTPPSETLPEVLEAFDGN